MNLRQLVSVTALVGFLFAVVTSQDCPNTGKCLRSNVLEMKKNLTEIVNFWKNHQLGPNSEGEIQQTFGRLEQGLPKIIPCFGLIPNIFPDMATHTSSNSSIVAKFIESTAKITTKECTIADAKSDAFKKDPCCNSDLREKKCCARREVDFTRKLIESWKPEFSSCCSTDTEKFTEYANEFASSFLSDVSKCQTKVEHEFSRITTLGQSFSSCFQEYFNNDIYCASDADCPGTTCFAGKCDRPSVDDDTSVNKFVSCVVNKFPEEVRYDVKLRFDLSPDASAEELGNKIKPYLTSSKCVDKHNPWITHSSLTTESACLSPTTCTQSDVSTTDCGTSNFCGMNCRNGICSTGYGSSVTESQCKDYGFCSGKSGYYSRSDCTSESYCTAHEVCPSCDQSNCNQYGYCVGFPFTGNQCVANVTESGCPEGFHTIYGTRLCMKYGSTCPSPGYWLSAPTTKEACESYKACKEEFGYNLMPPSECTKCGFSEQSSFKFVPGEWRSRDFRSSGEWLQRSVVKKNAWATSIDFSKLGSVISLTFSNIFRRIILLQINCNINPLLSFYESVSCVCSPDRPADTSNCIPGKVEVSVASFPVFKGKSSTQEFNGGSLKINSDSFSTSTDVEVIKTKNIGSGDQKRRRRLFTQTTSSVTTQVDVQNNDGTIVGSVLGTGMAISVAPDNAVELCINVDQTYTNANPSSYTKAAFCVEENNKFTLSSKTATNTDTDVKICSSISDTKTYYPCKTNDNAEPGGGGGGSGAGSLTSGFVIIALLHVVVMAIIAL